MCTYHTLVCRFAFTLMLSDSIDLNSQVMSYFYNEMPQVSLDVSKGKILIMFISYFDISDEEIKDIAQKIDKPEKQYDVVWLPIIDNSIESTEIKQEELTQKASLMPWYSLHHSSSLEPTVIKYIKEVLHFEKKPLFVVLNAQGNVVNPNAYHMMKIWGSDAFPFDTQREETLWKNATWSLDFLVDGIDDSIKEMWVWLYTVTTYYINQNSFKNYLMNLVRN